MKTKIFLSALLAASLFACQKEPDDSILQNPVNCTLQSAVYYEENGTPYDTCKLEYSNNQVTKAFYTDGYITLEYTNGRVTKRNFFITGTTTPFLYDVFTYNADGTFNKVESYLALLGFPLLYYTYDFTYANGKLAGILEKQDTTTTGGQLHPVYKYTFTFTGENITRIDEEDLEDSNNNDSYEFLYDNKANYYKKISNAYFFESFFLDLDSSVLPLILSGNNVTKIINVFGNTDLSYTEENGNIKELSLDGTKRANYNFNCQ